MSEDIVNRLEKWASLKVGDPLPEELIPVDGNWGPPLTALLNDAIAEIKRLRIVAGEVPWNERFVYPPSGPDKVDIGLMRKIATGDVPPLDHFIPKDWRPGAIAHLLYTSAEELAYLRPLAGAVTPGESFGEIRDNAKKPSKP